MFMKKLAPVLAIALVAGAPAVAQQTPSDASAMQHATAMQMKVADAFNKKDAGAVGDLYTQNATFIGADGKAVTGQAAIRDADAAIIKAWGDFTFKEQPIAAGTVGQGFWASYNSTVTAPDGTPKMSAHVFNVYVPVGNDWKIAATTVGYDLTAQKTAAQ
jgi:ketosteroid isomerase-like protein